MVQVLLFHADAEGGDRIKEILSAQACEAELTQVRNVTGFLEAMEQWRFDAVLLDYGRPAQESRAALAAMKQWWPGTPAIALGNVAAGDGIRAALQDGAAECVPQEHLEA